MRAIGWGNVAVGRYAFLSDDVVIHALAAVSIGAGTSVSPQVYIASGGHNAADLSAVYGEIHIGECVFIGARALVVRDVQQATVWAGVSAKQINVKQVPDVVWTAFGDKNTEDLISADDGKAHG